MSKKTLGFAAVLLTALAAASPARALLFDENVTNNVIFGSGNLNGGFTVDRGNGVEVGLRAKLRFDAANQPQNIFNSNGDGTYTFSAGQAPGGFSFDPNSPTTPVWSFEWSVNTNFDGSTSFALDDLAYEIRIDFDPNPGISALTLTFDPIIQPFADHAIGDNSTLNGGGVSAGTPAAYSVLISNNNLAQNSWNYEFFNNGAFAGFDPNVAGNYEISLRVFEQSDIGERDLAFSKINVLVEEAVAVPEPASGLLLLVGLAGLGVLRRRRAAG